MTHGGKSVTYEHGRLSKFKFRRMTTNTGYFLQSIARHELLQQAALVAEPHQTLTDLIFIFLKQQSFIQTDNVQIDTSVSFTA